MPTRPRKNRSNPEWIARHINDPYVKRSVAEGFRSRAAYKLSEIDDKDRLLRPGMVVVDLGAAPGSWTQVVRQAPARADGRLAGRIDRPGHVADARLPGVEFIQGDFHDEAVESELVDLLAARRVDVVLSDMAPNLSGIAAADAARSVHLAELAADFAAKYLQPNGAFLVKAFQGSGYSQYVERAKKGIPLRYRSQAGGIPRNVRRDLFTGPSIALAGFRICHMYPTVDSVSPELSCRLESPDSGG